MPDHPFVPSGSSGSHGSPLNACLRCGRTKAAHDLVLTWNDREYRFASVEEARRARFYPEVKS